MKRAMNFLIPPVTRHDGIVARLMGDALLAFFGAPGTRHCTPAPGWGTQHGSNGEGVDTGQSMPPRGA